MNESLENTSVSVSWTSTTGNANDSVPWVSSTGNTTLPDPSTSLTGNTSVPPTGNTFVPVSWTSLIGSTTTPVSLDSNIGYIDSSIIALLCTGLGLVVVISVIAVCTCGCNTAPRVHKRVSPKGLVFGVGKYVSKHYLSGSLDDESLSASDSDSGQVKTDRTSGHHNDNKESRNKIVPLHIEITQF